MKAQICPICGSIPIIEKVSLDRGNGHGYPGKYDYRLRCSEDDCPMHLKIFSCSDIYDDEYTAKETIVNHWNEYSDKVIELMKNK